MSQRFFFPFSCRYHSLLKSLKGLIGKTKSSQLKTLLDKHCPVLLPQEDALKSANATSQVDIFSLTGCFQNKFRWSLLPKRYCVGNMNSERM